MATGDLRRPTRRQRRRIDEAVRQAEARTGLQLAVVLGRTAGEEGDARAAAESAFAASGLVDRPAVLLVVDPTRHHIEVVTSPDAKQRIADDEAAAAVAVMAERFRARDLVGGITAGVARLAEAAGPGVAPPGAPDLPNLLEDDADEDG